MYRNFSSSVGFDFIATKLPDAWNASYLLVQSTRHHLILASKHLEPPVQGNAFERKCRQRPMPSDSSISFSLGIEACPQDDVIELQRQIMEYVDGVKPVPMVLAAPSSFGLSCTMAKAAEQAWLRDSGSVAVVVRYIHLASGTVKRHAPSRETVVV